MRRFTKWVLGIGMFCVLAGGLLAAAGWAMGGETSIALDWNGRGLQMRALSSRGPVKEAGDRDLAPFECIDVNVSFADITFVESETYGVALKWHGDQNEISYEVKDGALRIWDKDQATHIIQLGAGIESSGEVVVYYPSGEKQKRVSVKTGFGRVNIGTVKADSLTVFSDFGDVQLTNCDAAELNVNLDSGVFTGENLKSKTLVFENAFGKAEFVDCTAQDATVTMDSGDVRLVDCTFQSGNLSNSFGKIVGEGLATEALKVNSDSGETILSGTLRGTTEISASFGRVVVASTQPRSSYSWDLDVDFGRIEIDGEKQKDGGVVKESAGENNLVIRSDSGDVNVTFEK